MAIGIWSAAGGQRDLRGGVGLVAALSALALSIASCGGGGTATGPPPTPASISIQPVAQSVPMGLTASFSVTATGSSLQYQWYRGGAPILGATASSYTTPATTFADTGATFEVAVSNSISAVSSDAVALTVTARAPMAGDLRFQLVDAPSTVNGWGNAGGWLFTPGVSGNTAFSFSPSIGTPLYVGSGAECAPSVPPGGVGNCDWRFDVSAFLPTAGGALTHGYGGDYYVLFQSDLQTGLLPGSLGSGVDPRTLQTVITSLDLEPAIGLFGLSWVAPTPMVSGAPATQPATYLMEQNSVAVADLQAAVTVEGASGRVVTAVSNNGGPITYLAYGWQADPTSVYEAQVVTASTAGSPAAAAALAAQGYIITAIGPADSSGNILLVGTRLQGDTLPRPFLSTHTEQPLKQQGYAIVGVIFDITQVAEPYTNLGER